VNDTVIDGALMRFASEYNKNCPIFVDKDTRLDNIITFPGKKIQYNYTLVNVNADYFNYSELKANLEPVIAANVRTSPEMKWLREKKTVFIYSYKDKNGVFMFKINITPDIYNKQPKKEEQSHII
jgi:hypothetical protein